MVVISSVVWFQGSEIDLLSGFLFLLSGWIINAVHFGTSLAGLQEKKLSQLFKMYGCCTVYLFCAFKNTSATSVKWFKNASLVALAIALINY